jgi:hypothetical protein
MIQKMKEIRTLAITGNALVTYNSIALLKTLKY